MQTIQRREKTGKDGMLSLRIPMGKADEEYEVLVVIQPNPGGVTSDEFGWPAGYFDKSFGSIDDESFVRPPQGELPPTVEFAFGRGRSG